MFFCSKLHVVELVSVHGRCSDGSDFACFYQIMECFHGFFNWGFEVKSVDDVEVEIVCSQTVESTVDFSHDGRTGESTLVEVNFRGDDYFVTCDVFL